MTRCTEDDECPRPARDDGRCWWHGIDTSLAGKPSGVRLSDPPAAVGRYAGSMPVTAMWGDTSKPC